MDLAPDLYRDVLVSVVVVVVDVVSYECLSGCFGLNLASVFGLIVWRLASLAAQSVAK